jgi:N-acetylglucosamine kinase-like BadF-type ATPase
VEELVHAVSRVDNPSQQALARLAPVLLEAGHRGDPEARALVHEHGRMLAGYVRAAAHRVGLDERASNVVLSGGLLRHPCTDLVDAIVAGLPGCRVAQAAVEPAYGALLIAADAVSAKPSLDRLRESGPEATFFRTL